MLTITMYRLPKTADQDTQKRTCNPVYVDWLCLTSHRQRGHLETAPPFTVPCEGREARFLHRPNWDSKIVA